MDPKTTYDALKQIWDGDDIPAPRTMLARIKPEDAARKLPGAPYSLLTNLAHADMWNRIWLARLNNTKRPDMMKDWRVPSASEFDSLRASFLDGIQEAMRIASSKPFKHEMKDDIVAVRTLHMIAVHTAYHCGQMNLLKRMMKTKQS
jgi:hypothetical protein